MFITEHDRVRLFHNRGGGKFSEITREARLDNPHWGTSAAFFDYDRDGWLDLIVVNYVDYSLSMKCPDAQGKPGYCGPSGFPGTISRLFHNLGARGGGIRFEDVTLQRGVGEAGRRRAWASFARTPTEITGPTSLIANDGHVNWLLINQRNGTFTEEAATRGIAYNEMGAVQANMGIALGDADGDGLFDILVTHLNTETHALWKQGPRGYFQDRTTPSRVAASAWRGTGFGTVFSDLNNDGAPDLLVVNGGIKRLTIDPAPHGKANSDPFWNGYEQRSQIFANDGNGAFTDVSADNLAFTGTAAVARGLAVGDLNNDGGPDLLVTRIAAPARVYRNIAPRGHWLTVRVVEPTLGGRDAYGAEVTISAGGRRRTVWVNPSQSYLCSNDPRAHFGLGSATRVGGHQRGLARRQRGAVRRSCRRSDHHAAQRFRAACGSQGDAKWTMNMDHRTSTPPVCDTLWNDSVGSSNPKHQASEKLKPQTSRRPAGWPPHRSGRGLELEIWSFSGAWCLGFGALARATRNRL